MSAPTLSSGCLREHPLIAERANATWHLSLRADTVYGGELRFRLRWSVEELRRFMLSGDVPEHALP